MFDIVYVCSVALGIVVLLWFYALILIPFAFRDTYVKDMSGESKNDRNDRGNQI